MMLKIFSVQVQDFMLRLSSLIFMAPWFYIVIALHCLETDTRNFSTVDNCPPVTEVIKKYETLFYFTTESCRKL